MPPSGTGQRPGDGFTVAAHIDSLPRGSRHINRERRDTHGLLSTIALALLLRYRKTITHQSLKHYARGRTVPVHRLEIWHAHGAARTEWPAVGHVIRSSKETRACKGYDTPVASPACTIRKGAITMFMSSAQR